MVVILQTVAGETEEWSKQTELARAEKAQRPFRLPRGRSRLLG